MNFNFAPYWMQGVLPEEYEDFFALWRVALEKVHDEQIDKAMTYILQGKTDYKMFPPSAGAFAQLCESFRVEEKISSPIPTMLPDYSDKEAEKLERKGKVQNVREVLSTHSFPEDDGFRKGPQNRFQLLNYIWWTGLTPEARAQHFNYAIFKNPYLQCIHMVVNGEQMHFLDEKFTNHYSFDIFMETIGRRWREDLYAV